MQRLRPICSWLALTCQSIHLFILRLCERKKANHRYQGLTTVTAWRDLSVHMKLTFELISYSLLIISVDARQLLQRRRLKQRTIMTPVTHRIGGIYTRPLLTDADVQYCEYTRTCELQLGEEYIQESRKHIITCN